MLRFEVRECWGIVGKPNLPVRSMRCILLSDKTVRVRDWTYLSFQLLQNSLNHGIDG